MRIINKSLKGIIRHAQETVDKFEEMTFKSHQISAVIFNELFIMDEALIRSKMRYFKDVKALFARRKCVFFSRTRKSH